MGANPPISLDEIRAWLKDQLPGAAGWVDALPDWALYLIFALLVLGVLATLWGGIEWLLKRLGLVKDEVKQIKTRLEQTEKRAEERERLAKERHQVLLAAFQAAQAAAQASGAGAGGALDAAREARALADTEDPVLVAARDRIVARDFDGARAGLARDVSFTAERLRTLGFLESLRSVQAAIAAYEKAAALEPTDFWTAVQLGRLYRTAGDLGAGRRLALAALEQAKAPRDRSVALNELGDVLSAQSDLPGALKNYQEGLDIARALAKDDPSNAERRRDVAVSLERLGQVAAVQGDRDSAAQYWAEEISIAEVLFAADPSNLGWLRFIAVVEMMIAGLDLPDSAARLRRAADLLQRLESMNRLAPADQPMLAKLRSRLGAG